jgi:hypothetical protein
LWLASLQLYPQAISGQQVLVVAMFPMVFGIVLGGERAKKMILHLHCSTDFSITDGRGQVRTLEEAKAAVEAGKLKDCNLAFKRLIAADFDIDVVKKFYEENP